MLLIVLNGVRVFHFLNARLVFNIHAIMPRRVIVFIVSTGTLPKEEEVLGTHTTNPTTQDELNQLYEEAFKGSGAVAAGFMKYCTECVPFNNDKRNLWKIKGGTIESVKCKGMVMQFQAASNGLASIILAPKHELGWNQKWTIKSDAVRLLMATGAPGQEWRAVFQKPPYDFALLPGFPGDQADACLKGFDKELSKFAMNSCDRSMSLLLGRLLSVGTLREITAIIKAKGPEYMPGTCCMDSATNSNFFGYRVSIAQVVDMYFTL